MMKKTYPEELLPAILARVVEHGFVIFSSGFYNLNIIGVRNPNGKTNQFDDMLYVVHKELDESDNIIWAEYSFKCTTDPGLYWLKNGRSSGTAVLCHPQQCRSAYKIDAHRGKYKALCQRLKPVYVWRDSNKDNIVDYGGRKYTVNSGINIHRASQNFTRETVDRYSAGCTVIADPEDYDIFMGLCYKQQDHGMGFRFTYTILLGE